jgi:membrane protein involved in colicin uptake
MPRGFKKQPEEKKHIMEKQNNDSTSAIDAALNKAKARKAAKNGTAEGSTETLAKPAKAAKVAKEKAEPKRPRLSDEEKAARQLKKDAERAEKKTAREAVRATKKAERDAAKRTPHMSKVEKAAGRLPVLTDAAQLIFNDITTNFGRDQVAAVAAHLTHFNRVQATSRALGQKISAGDTVRIVGGDSRYIGQEGVVAKAQRIRCYVTVDGVKKDVYLFTSDVELVKSAAAAKTA